MYDAFAESFARSRNRSWPDIEEMFHLMAAGSHSMGRVLDVGCGSGRLVDIIGQMDSYLGIDDSAELVAIAKKQYPKYTFAKMDMRDISHVEGNFDTICFVASLHHLLTQNEQVATLRDAASKLSGNGRIAMLNWNLRNEKNSKRYSESWISEHVLDIPFSGNSRHYYAFTLAELESVAMRSGLRIDHHLVSGSGDNFITILRK